MVSVGDREVVNKLKIVQEEQLRISAVCPNRRQARHVDLTQATPADKLHLTGIRRHEFRRGAAIKPEAGFVHHIRIDNLALLDGDYLLSVNGLVRVFGEETRQYLIRIVKQVPD